MRVRNGRVEVALHERRAGEGRPLLLLHALYGSSADWGSEVEAWPGPVHALDFSGHGASGRLRGGAYSYERFLSDADLALRAIGTDAALAGAGMGAWYGMLLAATRAERIPACLLIPGAGLSAGGDRPDPRDVRPVVPPPEQVAAFTGSADPYVMMAAREPRPLWFAQPFAEGARRLVLLEDGTGRPPWWCAAREHGEAVPDLAAGLAALARATD